MQQIILSSSRTLILRIEDNKKHALTSQWNACRQIKLAPWNIDSGRHEVMAVRVDVVSHFEATNFDMTPEFYDADVLSHLAGHYGYYACYGYDDCYRGYSTRCH